MHILKKDNTVKRFAYVILLVGICSIVLAFIPSSAPADTTSSAAKVFQAKLFKVPRPGGQGHCRNPLTESYEPRSGKRLIAISGSSA